MRRARVPVLRQNTMADCGAACLAMVLGHHGRRASVREVVADVQVSRDGLTAFAIVEAAKSYGLRAKALSIAPERLGSVPGPFVVHWEFNHFLVVERWRPDVVEVVDPASGRRRLTPEEFDLGFTGVVLAFEPGPDFNAQGPERRPWRANLLRALLVRHRGLLVQALLASLLLQVAALVLPLLSGLVVDEVLPGGDRYLLRVLVVGLPIVVLIQGMLNYLRTAVLLMLRARADTEFTGGVVGRLFSLPYGYFTLRGASDLVMSTQSAASLRAMLSGQVLSALLDGPLAVVLMVLVLVRDPLLGGCLAAMAAVQVVLLLLTRRRIADLTGRGLTAAATTQGRLIESIQGIESIKASSSERRAVERWSAMFTSQMNADLRLGLTRGLLDSVLSAIRILAPALLLLVGTVRVLDGGLSLGTMLALNALAVSALTPLTSLLTSLQELQEAGAHVERLADIIEAEPERTGGARPPLRGEVTLSGVGFRFDPRSPWTLRNVTLRIAPGQKVALVGSSGSGKSTLGRILLGLYEPVEGELRYDGTPARDLDPRWLRGRFGVVTQDPHLFTGTIRENIALTVPGAPLERIVAAARLAHVHDDIMAMPMGYETMLAEGGGLSGGQRQRIALARALLPEPRILLLDEATSHLDTVAEAAIERNLAALPLTRVVIAHRLSTVRDADQILVIEAGQVAERGTHDELMRSGGRYATLSDLARSAV
ncbi:peptidase domain-containing ABC transporter [Nonomuraea wenchangensis]|uniref:ABC-type bacteriocin/lantibiotic exporter, contains an N-terminal double-glycine peptidase domain n=1 Tax=Nonomuraea wenchangensis TaxID=568860 RepID=A0A1I0I076_9ACTN|nr:peptidase domain-containing ABC transporter [Nonomuraea wenchangensis]SET89081.1 ABC-type bacteriocin/lantibiotic exporter, contains an N-terminal double-glycine peptidase domain [Nonomuraea wenchangensis]